ncbi:MAG: hypothetical protein ACXWZT_12160, partial [Gaiellaceae bacterium]
MSANAVAGGVAFYAAEAVAGIAFGATATAAYLLTRGSPRLEPLPSPAEREVPLPCGDPGDGVVTTPTPDLHEAATHRERRVWDASSRAVGSPSTLEPFSERRP